MLQKNKASHVILCCDKATLKTPRVTKAMKTELTLRDLNRVITESIEALSTGIHSALGQLREGQEMKVENLSFINTFIESANRLKPTKASQTLNMSNALKLVSAFRIAG